MGLCIEGEIEIYISVTIIGWFMFRFAYLRMFSFHNIRTISAPSHCQLIVSKTVISDSVESLKGE